jgi:carbon storage regulator
MLVLTRKVQESLIVGDEDGHRRLLKVTVLSISGQRVKLGFEMDDNVSVHRAELRQRLLDTALHDLGNPAPTELDSTELDSIGQDSIGQVSIGQVSIDATTRRQLVGWSYDVEAPLNPAHVPTTDR